MGLTFGSIQTVCPSSTTHRIFSGPAGCFLRNDLFSHSANILDIARFLECVNHLLNQRVDIVGVGGIEMTKTRLEINRVGTNLNQLARVANETDQIEKMETIEAVRKTVLGALAKYDALTEEMGDVLCHIQA